MIKIDRHTADAIVFDKSSKTGSFLFFVHGWQSCQVTVTRRGILSAAVPPRDGAARFAECIGVFLAIASEKLQRLGETPALWITAEDVRLWQRHNGKMAIHAGEADLAQGCSSTSPVDRTSRLQDCI